MQSYIKTAPGTFIIAISLVLVFVIEILTRTMGNESALLTLGALPASGQLNGEYWRLISYAYLHLNWTHLILNSGLLLWLGRIVERRVGPGRFSVIYLSCILISALAILTKYQLHPAEGASLGASGAIFGLLGAALVLAYRADMAAFNRDKSLITGLWICLLISASISFLPGVSLVGHAGGFILGLLLGALVTPEHEAVWFSLRREPIAKG